MFDRFIDRYLSEWARVKGAGSVRVEKEILSALAWRLGTSRTLLSADEAAATMSARLTELQNKKEAASNLNVATLNREFLEHGLLRESAGQTGFFHQAVQEYFFAREVALHQSMEYVLKHVSDPQWAEVLVFVCGLVEDATEVVREVMEGDIFWAMRCATNAKNINGEVGDELALKLIQNLKIKLDANIWVGRLYQDMIAVLSMESKTRSKDLTKLFSQVYQNELNGRVGLASLLIEMEIPQMAKQAISLLEPLIKNQPGNVQLRSMMASALREVGDSEGAIAHFNKCLDLASEDPHLWVNQGITYVVMKNQDKAKFCFLRAIELDRRLHWAYYHLGRIFYEQKNFEGALEQFQQASQLGEEFAGPHVGIANVYLEYLKQPEKAIIEYHIAIRLEQRPFRLAESFLGLARALEAAGRTAEARQRYQEYLDRFPWGERAQEAQAALERLGGE
ncbi:MAG: tetratricopeptide repeat protein [candidate division KSB1 bacterium]